MSVASDIDLFTELELDMSQGHQCETIWFAVGDDGFTVPETETPCTNPAIVRVKIHFDCGNFDVRWKCEYCLQNMLSKGKWGCIPCNRVEPFELEIL
jgi:hypothetical protein